MDIVVRIWDVNSFQIETHFLDAHYQATETADIQLAALCKTLDRIDIGLEKSDPTFER